MTEISLTDSKISLQEGNSANIMNRAIVIHENADTFTGFMGNAGSRISCGIIKSCDSTCQQTLAF